MHKRKPLYSVSGQSKALSIIITNYNYGRFLSQAIDSALAQPCSDFELIVVDDGSSDDSAEIIRSYGDRVIPTFKTNGGQTSAFNAGFALSRGRIVCFLDADDVLVSGAMAQVLPLFNDSAVVKVHWPLWTITGSGCRTGQIKPGHPLRDGDLREIIVAEGPDSPTWVPTSGNAWSRVFLEKVFPLPESERALGIGSASADAYLSMLAPLFGLVRRVDEPQGEYRVHGKNDHSCMNFEKRLVRDLELFENRAQVLLRYCAKVGLAVNPAVWRERSWFHKLQRAVITIEKQVPPGSRFVLVDDGAWGWRPGGGREAIPFLEGDQCYAGPPANDEVAIGELERVRSGGARFMVFAWSSFWWLDFYQRFARHLRDGSSCVWEDSDVVIFRFGRVSKTRASII